MNEWTVIIIRGIIYAMFFYIGYLIGVFETEKNILKGDGYYRESRR